jgi:ABC-type phosphate transport system permease subunit
VAVVVKIYRLLVHQVLEEHTQEMVVEMAAVLLVVVFLIQVAEVLRDIQVMAVLED